MDPAQRMLLETAYRALENGILLLVATPLLYYSPRDNADPRQLEFHLSVWRGPTQQSSLVPQQRIT